MDFENKNITMAVLEQNFERNCINNCMKSLPAWFKLIIVCILCLLIVWGVVAVINESGN